MTIQLKRNTAAGAAANNEILADGQPGWDSTNKILKIGDGTTHWNDLPVAFSTAFAPIAEPVALTKVGLDSQIYDVTNNRTGHQITAGSGAGDQAPALNALIAAVPSGSRLYVPAGSYYFASGIEIINKVNWIVPFPFATRFVAIAGFTDNQMIRNWKSTDYTGGETDHTLAPLTTTAPNYYVSFQGGLALDVNGNSNLTCAAFVHIQERSRLDMFFVNTPGTGSGNIGLRLFSNSDVAGNCAGRYEIRNVIQYSAGWQHMVRVDGSNGGKNPSGMVNDLKLIDFTSSPGGSGANYSDSVIYIQQASNVFLDLHLEGSPPVGATDSAIIRLVDVAGCKVLNSPLNSGAYDMYRPFVRATSTGTLPVPWKALSPELDNVTFGGAMHAGAGNYIEDEIPVNGVATSRHFAYDATLFVPVRIIHYDGASIRWLDKFDVVHDDKLPDVAAGPATAIAESVPRTRVASVGLSITSGRLVLVKSYLYVGQVVTSIKWVSNTTALATGSNQWAALFDPSRNKLAVSADDTSTAWGASTQKTFTLAAPYTITVSGWYYFGLCVVATTTPSLIAHNIPQVLNSISPVYAGNSDTGLTNPASCPATAASPTSTAGIPYAYAS